MNSRKGQLRLVGVPYKRCSKCGITDITLFGKDASRSDGLSSRCRKCDAANASELRRKYPGRARMVQKRSVYKVCFETVWREQGGMCAACGAPMLSSGKDALSAVVDHDHRCCPGQRSCGTCVRGLVHSRCNIALGHALEDAEVLRRLADYAARIHKESPR